jgi:hypothetical protein
VNRPGPAAIAWLGAAVFLLSGCVTPARTSSTYEQKAAMTAEAAVSAARTAVLAAETYAEDKLPTRYLEPVLVESEETLGEVESTFDSIQPPGVGNADEVRAELDPLLQKASSAATEMRIAARRHRSDDLAAAADDLAKAADELDAFAQEHAP